MVQRTVTRFYSWKNAPLEMMREKDLVSRVGHKGGDQGVQGRLEHAAESVVELH